MLQRKMYKFLKEYDNVLGIPDDTSVIDFKDDILDHDTILHQALVKCREKI